MSDFATLQALPLPVFAERDTGVIRAKLVARFEVISGRTLYPAQPENYTINLMAYALANVGSAVQTGLLQNRVIWANGRHLDDLGANVSTYRLAAQKARAEVKFTLAETRATGVVIPKGTRVAAGGDLVFGTTDELVIPAGAETGLVTVEALFTGAKANDLQPGQIQDILDPVAYVASVTNTQVSAGGSDVEDDPRFRLRVANASDRITRAGSRQGYIELVKAAHPGIVDVEAIRPEPGHVNIYPLMATGVAPAAVLDVIDAYLDPETRRPMGDYVTLHDPSSVVFDVTLRLKVTPGYAAGTQDQARSIVENHFTDLGQRLGVQVAPSALIEALRQVPGIVGIDGPGFDFTDLAKTEFAQLGALVIDVVEAPNV
ncbi:MAG: baseplate J/gp47 family protein [Marinovum sp.]|nr:baseplate J/gp47 family protein [Marinovum sp.]